MNYLRYFVSVFILTVLSVALLGCGLSPLFNNRGASPSPPKNPSIAVDPPQGEMQHPPSCDVQFIGAKLCAELIWRVAPQTEDSSDFTLIFHSNPVTTGDESILTDVKKISVDLFMPSMGHGSAPVKTVFSSQSNVVEVSSVYFIMPGVWQMRFKITFKDGQQTDAIHEITL